MTKTLDQLRATPAHVVCEHGASQRSCDSCECLALYAENEALKARVGVLEGAIRYAIEEIYDTESISVGTDELRRVLMPDCNKELASDGT